MAKYTEELRQAWKEVFEVEEVADDADFFAEGGDSIKAVQLSSWLQQKGIKLDLGKIFYTPVFSDMAETLEETEPMYVPDELMTKELINEKLNDIVQNGGGAQAAPKAGATQANGQVCDPKEMPAAKPQADGQVCDPNKMPSAMPQADGQVCDPNKMAAPHAQPNGQVCDPNKMPSAMPQADGQVCDPNKMAAPHAQPNGQVCDPNKMPSAMPQANGQVCDPAPMPARNADYDMMISMFQTMLAQQQVMLQMMQVMLSQRNQAPQFLAPMQGGGVPFRAPFRPQAPVTAPRFPVQAAPAANRAQNMGDVSPEVRAQLAQQMQKYQSHPVDKPIEKPNVIGLKPAKVAKAEHSAEEVLDHVLSGLLGDGYSRTEDFFEQGLTSFDVVKMVTRCGEHGYALRMQDVYMHSTFDELLGCMKPGE